MGWWRAECAAAVIRSPAGPVPPRVSYPAGVMLGLRWKMLPGS